MYSLRQKFCVTVLPREELWSTRRSHNRAKGRDGLDLVRAVLPVDDVPAGRSKLCKLAGTRREGQGRCTNQITSSACMLSEERRWKGGVERGGAEVELEGGEEPLGG